MITLLLIVSVANLTVSCWALWRSATLHASTHSAVAAAHGLVAQTKTAAEKKQTVHLHLNPHGPVK